MSLLTKNLKKNLSQIIKTNKDAELLFCDEARFGTRSKLGYGWFKKGTRTQVKVKLGYKNFYLYGAVSPFSGKNFSLLLPKANTECMRLFLAGLVEEFGDKKIILVMDRASWHHSKDLKIPTNIEIVYLPAYSPELNPIERLWLYIKHHTIRNRIYEDIDDLEDAICDFINNLSEVTTKSICRASYLFS